MWFSPAFRTCTSGWKVSPIEKIIRADMKARGATVCFNVTGIRAEESNQRAKKNPLFLNMNLTNTSKRAMRTCYDWMPIFHYSVEDVWQEVKKAGKTMHPAYGEFAGDKNDRLSCVVCMMANLNDITLGVLARPDIYHEYIAVERIIKHTMFIKSSQKTIKWDETDLITGEVIQRKRVEKTVVKIPLEEKVGLPFNELEVARWVKKLTVRREELLAIKAETEAQAAEARRLKKTGKQAKNKDTHTLALALAI
jgi:3'-phosphoadenosine 5'-phosphosulfate sulfotransferase (PAPS reductase)/FAD synthetase